MQLYQNTIKMKVKLLSILFLASTLMTFGQKKEVKALEKAVKSANFSDAKSAVAAAESLLSSMDQKTKEKFLLLKGQAFLGANNKNIEDLKKAAVAFNEIKGSGSVGAAAQQGLATLIQSMVGIAIDNQNTQNYGKAAEVLEQTYDLSPIDTSFLYFAGTNAINGKNYTQAASIYQKLVDVGYTGREKRFTAIDKTTGVKKDDFASEVDRDLFVKSGEYINPAVELTESKRGDIIKTLATLYIQTDQNETALEVIDKALALNPNDLSILETKASTLLKLGRRDEFFKINKELIEKDPNNGKWYYNLGVGYHDSGNTEEALKNYEKAIELSPENIDAYNNIVQLILDGDEKIRNEMNSLGNSRADFDRFDALKLERQKIQRKTIPYLEKALDIDPENRNLTQQLFQIHSILGNQSEADAVKARLDALPEN